MRGHPKQTTPLFYNSDNTIARQLQAFNAMIRSKLMYGMETIVFNTSIQTKLETVQLNCLRNILKYKRHTSTEPSQTTM